MTKKNLKIVASLIVVCLSSIGVKAQEMKLKIIIPTSLLWKISGNGLTADSYILFTENTCEKNIQLSAQAKEALGKVNVVAVENNLYDSPDANKMNGISHASADSEQIKNNLDASQFDLLQTKLVEFGIPQEYLKVYNKFSFGSLYYVLADALKPCGDNPGELFETYFMKYAKKNKLTYETIQSVDDVISEYRIQPNSYWKKNILAMMQNADQLKETFKNEYQAYHGKDIAALSKIYAKSTFFQNQLAGNSNNTHQIFLAQGVKKLIASNPTFISLPVSNALLSSENVLSILREEGYEVEPINE